jgi:hypothetical protein
LFKLIPPILGVDMLFYPVTRKLIGTPSKSTYNKFSIIKDRPEMADLLANDAQLRIWLPEPLRHSMDLVSRHLDTTFSKYLREYFVVYLYGNHALIDMYNHQTGIFYSPPLQETTTDEDYNAPMFSRVRSVEFIPGLGKNIVPLKIFLNAQIKADLQILADKSGVALSHFVREILVSHFLGHTVWPERQQMLKAEHIAVANQWEAGDLESQVVRSPGDEEENALKGKVERIYL